MSLGGSVVVWIYNHLCNQCLSPLTLWVLTTLMTSCTWYNSMWSSLSVICGRSVDFSQYNWPPRYNWNIIESDVRHHNPPPSIFPIDWTINSCPFEWPYWPICLLPHLKQQRWNQLCCYMKGVAIEERATLTTTLSNWSVRGDHKVALCEYSPTNSPLTPNQIKIKRWVTFGTLASLFALGLDNA